MKEKISYMKGLIEGLKSESDSKEMKILIAIGEILSEIADSLQEIKEKLNTMNDYIEEIDRDLGELEEYVYSEGTQTTIECPYCGEIFSCEKRENGDEEIFCPVCHRAIINLES
jgi:formylmethanofuran dehydrogenase subunit E